MHPKITFPNECLEDIFKYLGGSDLLQCSLVCLEWNDFIGTTRSCMRKIGFRVVPDSSVEIAGKVLMESDRKYACLELEANYEEKVSQILSAKNRKWIDIKSRLNFDTSGDFHSFLQTIEPSIQRLTVLESPRQIRVEETECGSFDFQFPNLKHLDIENSSVASLHSKAFVNCKNLVTAAMRLSNTIPQSELDRIAANLKCNKKLKVLSVSGVSVFSEVLSSKVDFKLRKLRIGHLEHDHHFSRNLNSFLKTQKNSLESLDMEPDIEVEVFKTILSMPRLNDINMRTSGLDALDLLLEIFRQKSPASTFSFVGPFKDDDHFKMTLNVFPKVVHLKISTTIDEIAEVISQACISVQNMFADNLSATNEAQS